MKCKAQKCIKTLFQDINLQESRSKAPGPHSRPPSSFPQQLHFGTFNFTNFFKLWIQVEHSKYNELCRHCLKANCAI